MDTRDLGKFGEDLACEYLVKNGYKIIGRNYRINFGEIDIIAREGDTLCFVEVKTRRSSDFGEGSEAVATLKKRKLCQTALWYLTQHRMTDAKARFDVVSILLEEGARDEIELIKNAFEVNEGLF